MRKGNTWRWVGVGASEHWAEGSSLSSAPWSWGAGGLEGGKVNSKAFIAGKLGRATLLFCVRCPQGRPAALKYLPILEKCLLQMPVSWDLGTVPNGVCSHTDSETHCHPLSVPSVTCPSLAWLGCLSSHFSHPAKIYWRHHGFGTFQVLRTQC